MIGVYAIVNLNDGRGTTYVGSTTSGFRKRWLEHWNALEGGYHKNPHLQAAWDKYGTSAFRFLALEIMTESDGVIDREQYWVDRLGAHGGLYNIVLDVHGSPTQGRPNPHTSATRQKISEGLKRAYAEGRKMRPNHSGTNNPMYGVRGEDHPCYGSTQSVETRAKISRAQAKSWRSGDRDIAYLETDEFREKCRRAHVGQGAQEYPAFINVETDAVIPAGCNLAALCREMGLAQSHMTDVKNGKRKSHKGWMLLEGAD